MKPNLNHLSRTPGEKKKKEGKQQKLQKDQNGDGHRKLETQELGLQIEHIEFYILADFFLHSVRHLFISSPSLDNLNKCKKLLFTFFRAVADPLAP